MKVEYLADGLTEHHYRISSEDDVEREFLTELYETFKNYRRTDAQGIKVGSASIGKKSIKLDILIAKFNAEGMSNLQKYFGDKK